MQAKLFIDLLERQELLDPEILSALRKQVAESNARLTPENIAKLLVDNGQLSRFQASKLIASLKESVKKKTEPLSPSKPSKSQTYDDLGFAEEATPSAESKPNKSNSARDEDNFAAIIVDDDDTDDVEVVDVDVVDEVVEVDDVTQVEVVDVVDSMPAPSGKRFRTEDSAPVQQSAASNSVDRIPTVTLPKPTKKKKNRWDSYKFMAPLFIFLLLLIPFVALLYWQFSGTAAEALESAKSAYEARDYDNAIKRYEKFIEGFPTNENVSFSKVRIGLSKIRGAIDRNSDPRKTLDVVKEVLPTIEKETGLAGERPDLAGALLSLAEKFNLKADGAKTTDEKEQLLKGFDEHWEFLANATYLGSQERTQFEQRMAKIKEDRQRIEQDIIRAKDLAATTVNITAALDVKNVNEAFQLRKDLVRRHPQLEVEPTIAELVIRASGILKELVQSATEIPTVVTEDPNKPDGKSIVLANVRGKKIDGENDVAFVRVKGSIYAINVADGAVLWRRYVGRSMSDPIRMSKDPDSDLLLTIPSQGILQRVRARDGKMVWQVQMQGELVEPAVDREDLIVGLKSGSLFCLDAVSGQVRWGKKLPQELDVGACMGTGRDYAYVAGNQSSLYVMSRKDGKCEEVVYVGHLKNSIRVPPVYALGHVLVFENGAGFSYVRILQADKTGAGLFASQPPMRMQGHVVVPVQTEGRRVTTMTDRGEIAVLDIEPSNEKNQVTKIAGIVANETQPRVSWILVDKNELWITSSRFIRYEIQVSRQELVRTWIKEEGDEFVTRPQRFGDHVIHARYVRGTDGIRVSCVDGKSGDPTWEADLGVPVTMLNLVANNVVQGMTTQAALFSVDAQAREKGIAVPVENPGRNQRQLLFGSPVRLADGRIFALNKNQNNQIALYDPKATAGNSLRVLVLSGGGVDPSCDPISVGSSVLICGNNGQIVMIDPSTGQQVADPFQPTVTPGTSYKWLKPAVLSDKQTIIAADNNQRMFKISTGKQFRALNEVVLPSRLKGQLAAIKDSVVAIVESPSGDVVQLYNGIDLQPSQSLALQGSVVAGPFVVGGVGYVLTDGEGLVSFDGEAKKLWEAKLPQISLIGEPQLVDTDLVLVGLAGEVLRLASQDGKLIGSANVGEMISASPVVLQGGVVMAGDEGTVFTVKMPDSVGGKVE